MAHIEAGWPDSADGVPEPPVEQQTTGAMRSWLVHGPRKFAIDQRRRFGSHGQSRRLLGADGKNGIGANGSWQNLVAALQRQAVHDALAQLRKPDRQILTLAYLRGHTNREIAAILGVSLSTVSRRLTAALARLDEYVRKAGLWVVSIALLGLAYLRSVRWPGGMTTAATSTAAVVAFGLVALGPASSEARQSATPATIQATGAAPDAPGITLISHAHPAGTGLQVHSAGAPPDERPDNGCNGNPTSAPPTVPVGPRAGHPEGPPVTNPAHGGCRPAG